MIYKILNDQAPQYLKDILPKRVFETVPYPVRNSENFKIPVCRIQCFERSFIPYGCSIWNELDLEIRHADTVSYFSHLLKKHFYPVEVSKDKKLLYSIGERNLNIIHSKIRVGCSNLNSDLCFNLRVKDNPFCSCGSFIENAHHFFIECPIWHDLRLELISTISELTPLNLNIFLYGDRNLSLEQNMTIFHSVQRFIKNTMRFED